MDNPWATAWDNPSTPIQDEADIALPSWSAATDYQWPRATVQPWPQPDYPSQPTSEQDITTQDQRNVAQPPPSAAPEPAASVSDHQVARSTLHPPDAFDPVPETTVPSVTRISDENGLEAALDPPDDNWAVAWGTTPSSETSPRESQAPDHWEAARQEKEKFNRAVPPELLDSLLRHCQQVSQEIWPASETSNEDDWRSGVEDLPDIAALCAQLVPVGSTLPPAVQFSATATAKAMNEALKLTRHLPASANSPLSRLLASKGSLEWEKSIKAKQDVVPDTAYVGWRVLEKDGRLSTIDESKPKKATGGLLSFWNRRTPSIQATPVETPSERSARSSLESTKSVPHPPSSRAASPSKAPIPSIPPPPPPDSNSTVIASAPAPSAVSRFLNRFSRAKSAQHGALALSSDDLEFLSDIVPSASDPPDEDTGDNILNVLTVASNSSCLPPRLPPPISPPPKQPSLSTRPSSTIVEVGALDNASVVDSAPTNQGVNHTPIIPVLAPPLSAKPVTAFPRSQTPSLSLKGVVSPTIGRSTIPLIQQSHQPSPQPTSRPYSSVTLPPPQKVPPLLSIPPLLPPPPVSPPQTPRPGAFPPKITPSHSFTMQSTDVSSFHDSHDPDDEFSAFTSFPSSTPTPFPSSDSQRSPSPPSPPPRRVYERTHYPSTSSASSIISPASQTSADLLCSAKSSISASLDGFDDFVSSPPVKRGENRNTPSPPPLPIKPQSQYQEPLRANTPSSRPYHAHTSSQTFPSPTVNTSLMSNAFSMPFVSDADHQRTQSLVNQAAARGGYLWPNSPESNSPKVMAIPPPPSSSTSSKPLIGEEDFSLLDGIDTLNGRLEAWHMPLNVDGTGMDSIVSSPATDPLRAPSGVASGQGKVSGSSNQPQPSPPSMPSTSTAILSFSSLSTPAPFAATNTGSLQPAKPKQTNGLSAQDLSFFEGW